VSHPHAVTLNDVSEPATPIGEGGLVSPQIARFAHDPAGTPKVRLRLDLSYDGTDFAGWARQPRSRTVEQVLVDALTTVLRLDEPARVTVAGRTDAGTHATGQVAHVDVPPPDDVAMVARRLAGILPHDVALRAIAVAPNEFNARFSALGRRYIYRVDDGTPNPLRRRDTVSWSRRLDTDAMRAAAQGLVGKHDFSAYCKPRQGATTIRTLHQLDASRDADSVVIITAYADAFCRHQVRSMVGALLAVGENRRPVDWPVEVMQTQVRDSLVNVAPASGLTLVAVDYPPDDELAGRAVLTRQRRAY
jgi:tRNA pseudouridine38-40 synthase